MKPACSSSADFSVLKWSQSRTAIPKSISRVRRPGGLPKTCLRMTSRAVAPARKYFVSCLPAMSSIFLMTSRTVGSIWSCLISKGGLNVFVINHLCGLKIPSVCCCREVGIGQNWRHHITNFWYLIRIPEGIENLDISIYISPHPLLCNQLLWCVPRVYRRGLWLKIVHQPIGRDLASPERMVGLKIQALRPIGSLRSKSPDIELRSKNGWV